VTVQRNLEFHASAEAFPITSVAVPISAREFEIPVRRHFDRDAELVVLAEAVYAFPFVPRALEVAVER
jgi:hypothetical protein